MSLSFIYFHSFPLVLFSLPSPIQLTVHHTRHSHSLACTTPPSSSFTTALDYHQHHFFPIHSRICHFPIPSSFLTHFTLSRPFVSPYPRTLHHFQSFLLSTANSFKDFGPLPARSLAAHRRQKHIPYPPFVACFPRLLSTPNLPFLPPFTASLLYFSARPFSIPTRPAFSFFCLLNVRDTLSFCMPRNFRALPSPRERRVNVHAQSS